MSVTVHDIENITYHLNTKDAAEVYDYYDVGMSYHLLSQSARQEMKRGIRSSSTLKDEGLIVHSVFSAEVSKALSLQCQNESQQLNTPAVMKQLFRRVFSGETDQLLCDYFQSEYTPLWYKFESATYESKMDARSFKWHCDSGPRNHLKLLIYLNDYEIHEGTTLFLNRKSSEAFIDAGYAFGPVDYRQHELRPLSKALNLPYEEISLKPKAGDAVIFEPSRLLHKGISPKPGSYRNVLHILLIPFIAPWQEAIETFRFPPFDDNRWPTFSQIQ